MPGREKSNGENIQTNEQQACAFRNKGTKSPAREHHTAKVHRKTETKLLKIVVSLVNIGELTVNPFGKIVLDFQIQFSEAQCHRDKISQFYSERPFGCQLVV